MQMYKYISKPILDFIVSLVLVVFISPIFILLMLSLLIVTKGNPFFTQPRPGKRGKVFKVIKFRTMNDKHNRAGDLLADADRLTPIGRLIRKTSLDEIPQIINVLKGDMSLIGPRPLLVEYLPLYNKNQARRHQIRPGITGWAQVNGRNAISWEQKFNYDVWYIDHCTFTLDMKILFKTIENVFKSEGISQECHATTEKFTGTK